MKLKRLLGCCGLVAFLAVATTVQAQGIQEDFNTVAGDPPTVIIDGGGFNQVNDWESGISGESAFAGTTGNLNALVSVFGSLTDGVANTGAAVIDFIIASFNVVELDFENLAAPGTTEILAGLAGPDTFNFIDGWDANIAGEFAFGGTFGGATLNGNMSVTTATTGGNPAGHASLDVNDVSVPLDGGWYAGLQFDVGSFPGATALANPGFEDSDVGTDPASWSLIGNPANVNVTDVSANSGTRSLSLVEFTQFGGAGVTQTLPAVPGQLWELDAFFRTNSGDSIAGLPQFILFEIQYYDSNNVSLGNNQAIVMHGVNNNPPENTWIDLTGLQALAPPDTSSATFRIFYINTAGTGIGGTALIDDVSLNLISGPQPVALDDFALLADVRGLANAAGEMLGDVQVRIEDSDGDRILFNSTATGAYQTIGGALDTGIEADANGTPTPGAFNILSPSFSIVVAFGDSVTWGSGGTIDVDNIMLTNSNPAGSNLSAGLLFQNLQLNSVLPQDVSLTADVFGDVPGGEYQLKLRAFDTFTVGLDEDFESVVDTGEVVFLDTPTIAALQPNAVSSTLGWSPDIDGEEAFGGVQGLVDTVSFSPRIYANGVDGLPTGGCQSSMRGGQIGAESISTNGSWFAGLSWPGQRLASADLSQVQLSACVRGLEDPSDPFNLGQGNGFLGGFELRIEDPDGDRLYFFGDADGSPGVWQSMGGSLDTATFGPAFDGNSNGVFDINNADPDSLVYTVVLAFDDPVNTWFSGGILQIDNLFLTPVDASVEIAEFTFDGVADGSTFQTIGGQLDTAGGPTFGNFDQDFEDGATTPGLILTAGGGGDFDDNLQGENFFFGGFGATIIDGAEIRVCPSCGVGGSQAIEMTVTNNPPDSWFAGVFFEAVPLDLSGDLSQIELRADIKGEIVGGTFGTYVLRIEDANTDTQQFSAFADGTFQSIGGTLDTATLGVGDPGLVDGSFDFFQSTYNVTVAFVGLPGGEWGPGGKLTIDNWFVTGRDLSTVDQYEVSLEFLNPVSSYPGGSGMLILDNLNLSEGSTVATGDVNCDGSINGIDVQAFVTAVLDPAGYPSAYPGCNILNADTNTDTNVGLADVSSFVSLLLSQ